ncbi:trypsin-3-like isoform X2 [Babylonia areolata]
MAGVVAVVVAAVALALSGSCQGDSLANNTIQFNLLRHFLLRRAFSSSPSPPSPAATTPTRTAGGLPQARIIGGSRVTERCKAPFNSMAAMQLYANDPVHRLTHCSGVLISPDVVVTAASCLMPYFNFPTSALTILLGESSFDFVDRYQASAYMDEFKIHHSFNNFTLENNIGLIKLRAPAALNECVQPMQLYRGDATQCTSALMNCTVTGWGPFFYDPNSKTLQNSKQPLYGHIRLADEAISRMLAGSPAYPNVTMKPNNLLGLPYPDWNIQTCLLDWGGMAACQIADTWKLRGIISEHNCIPTGNAAPMEFSNVEKFRSWIDACVNDFKSSACQAFVP